MQDQLAHYQIERLIGSGGMGEVYLARDTRLGRRVAIKILPSQFAEDPQRLRRFEREARAASIISHPNVAQIYDVGEADGIRFIAMEYVEGAPLGLRLREGALSAREAIRVGQQVAEALEAAHAAGVVHRDIKPANIMLQARNHVKVLDFGLAKYESGEAARTIPASDGEHTEPGAVMGTAPYMSPEQVAGQPVDHRSDIFSLGAVLYETVAGRRAFDGRTREEVLGQVQRGQPASLERLPPGTPPELVRIIRTCLAKEPERRFQGAGKLAADLERLGGQLDAPGFAETESLVAAARRRPRRLALTIVLSALAVLALVEVGIRQLRPTSVKAIAVLPFEVTSSDPALNYVGEAVSESLADDLGHLPGVRVASPMVTGHYLASHPDPLAVGKAFKSDVVLAGHVVVHGDSLHAHVELIDARQGSQIWSQEADENLEHLAAFQQALREKITDRLRMEFSGAWKQRLARQYATSSEAYQSYLQGRQHLNRRTLDDLRQALHWFEQAVARDPRYAPAYAGIADALALITNYSAGPPLPPLRKAKEAALRALEIDDSLGEAHASLGFALTLADFDWEGAEKEYQRALDLDPNYVPAHEGYAMCVLMPQGRHEEAVSHIQRAIDLEPTEMLPRLFLGVEQFFSRRYDRAEQTLRPLETQTPLARVQLAEVLLARSRTADTHTVLALLADIPPGEEDWVRSLRAYTLAVSGQVSQARQQARQMDGQAEAGYVSPYTRSWPYIALGENEQALTLLEQSYEIRDPPVGFAAVDPKLDPLRGDPRFEALLHRMRLR